MLFTAKIYTHVYIDPRRWKSASSLTLIIYLIPLSFCPTIYILSSSLFSPIYTRSRNSQKDKSPRVTTYSDSPSTATHALSLQRHTHTTHTRVWMHFSAILIPTEYTSTIAERVRERIVSMIICRRVIYLITLSISVRARLAPRSIGLYIGFAWKYIAYKLLTKDARARL